LAVLADYYKPEWDIEKGIAELMRFYRKVDFSTEVFMGHKTVRLRALKKRMKEGSLDSELRIS
jgi:hypothetical protein